MPRSAMRIALLTITMLIIGGCSSDSFFQNPVSVLEAPDQPGFSAGEIYYDHVEQTISFSPLHQKGIDIDLLTWLSNNLKVSLPYSLGPAADRDTGLTTHKYDLVIYAYSMTSTRNQAGVDFAGPYMKSDQALLVRTDDKKFAGNPASASIRGKSYCNVTGTTGSQPQPVAALDDDGAVLQASLETTADCVNLLLGGKVDMVFGDTLVLDGFAQVLPSLEVILHGVYGQEQYYGVGLAGGQSAYCHTLNQQITNYLQSQWLTDFRTELYSVAEMDPNFEQDYKPTADDMANYSCKL
jgi:glutamate transport system substrate-binding protein